MEQTPKTTQAHHGADHQIMTGEEQLQQIWQSLQQNSTNQSIGDAAPADEKKPRKWPTYDEVMGGIIAADYNQILTCPMDVSKPPPSDKPAQGKTLCPHGVVCCARLELFPQPDNNSDNAPYTGILEPGTTWEHCLLRLSSAMLPPNKAISSSWARTLLYATGEKLRNAQLFPGTALKVFPNKTASAPACPVSSGAACSFSNNSRNVLFAGSKVGQKEADFFAHCQCTSMTERMPSAVKPFVRKFWEYSKWPLSLGISDFCKPLDAHNNDEINFPFALILKPRISSPAPAGDAVDEEGPANNKASGGNGVKEGRRNWSRWSSLGNRRGSTKENAHQPPQNTTNAFDSFVDFALDGIPAETVLFDLFACPTPYDVADAAHKLQRIGRIVSTTPFVESSAPNDRLFFKHQAKEEDYALRPDWPEALKQQVTVEDGKVKGTVGMLAGWQLFEEEMQRHKYQDFEHAALTASAAPLN